MGGASCTGACARDFCGAGAGAAFFAAAGAGCGLITAPGTLRAAGAAAGSDERCDDAWAPCAAGSGDMMLIGGIDAALGKSPDTGRPGGGTVPSAATGGAALAVTGGAFHAAA